MTVTATEVHREAKRVLRAAQQGVRPILVTDHGQPMAEIRAAHPRRVVSIEELQAADISDEAIGEAVRASHAR